MEHALVGTWPALLRTAIVGVLAYIGLVVLLRATGKRTLSKMNAFDFVVTVALGSTLATILLSGDVSLARGVLALALLASLQFAITWSSVRVRWLRRIVTGEPALVLHRGGFLPAALRRVRVTEDEVRAAVRSRGIADLREVHAVVLETDGSFSVIAGSAPAACSTLQGVEGVEEP
jgi:uncharacterized membrane protein YcaP (DUF421 family)